jgi:SAM-dependent methyltransferase
MMMDGKLLDEEVVFWTENSLGKHLLSKERKCLMECLTKLNGYYLLQLGGIIDFCLFSKNPASSNIYLASEISELNAGLTFVYGEFDALPFANDSIDIIVAPHVLEFSENPYLILQEIYHTLVPEGKVIIFGFNPLSLLGLRKLCSIRKDKHFPWNGRFLNIWRVQNWLTHLGFAVSSTQTFTLNKGLEKIGKICCPYFCGCYMILAEKKIVTLISVEERKHADKIKLALSPARGA